MNKSFYITTALLETDRLSRMNARNKIRRAYKNKDGNK